MEPLVHLCVTWIIKWKNKRAINQSINQSCSNQGDDSCEYHDSCKYTILMYSVKSSVFDLRSPNLCVGVWKKESGDRRLVFGLRPPFRKPVCECLKNGDQRHISGLRYPIDCFFFFFFLFFFFCFFLFLFHEAKIKLVTKRERKKKKNKTKQNGTHVYKDYELQIWS